LHALQQECLFGWPIACRAAPAQVVAMR
jgi:hypothetical protein